MDVKMNQAAGAYARMANIQTTGKADDDAITNSSNTAKSIEPSFKELVAHSLDKARGAGYEGESVSAAAIAGKAELHELVTAITNAELTLQTVVAVRDKAVGAYQDIIKMPI